MPFSCNNRRIKTCETISNKKVHYESDSDGIRQKTCIGCSVVDLWSVVRKVMFLTDQEMKFVDYWTEKIYFFKKEKVLT
jgi:hypothetical protein